MLDIDDAPIDAITAVVTRPSVDRLERAVSAPA
jgi:hypothetical protein